MQAERTEPTADEVRDRIERRVAAALARGARVVGWIPSESAPRDVILSDDPPGSTYGVCPPEARG